MALSTSKPKATPSNSEQSKSSFGSRSTKHRALRKVKSTFPKSPRARAEIVEKLVQSPTCRKRLESKGLVISPDAKRQLELAASLESFLVSHMQEVTPRGKGTVAKDKKHAHDVINVSSRELYVLLR